MPFVLLVFISSHFEWCCLETWLHHFHKMTQNMGESPWMTSKLIKIFILSILGNTSDPLGIHTFDFIWCTCLLLWYLMAHCWNENLWCFCWRCRTWSGVSSCGNTVELASTPKTAKHALSLWNMWYIVWKWVAEVHRENKQCTYLHPVCVIIQVE